ncbi:MBL fold metallo-hydrolase [Undibacterium sp. CY18W]|uniref:MBL fold metallo-hydrolase n=1 Tax=Undibacterium hunanense TaxID=2762292 RepID=A0ABR6ZTE0_9BURK|nr:MBL fold metallo-hydrolase [Undibacterium hunanense]MBC3919130.1 MBL fold metallo-hydrolase [Undibacterium hunanense]
MRLKNGLQKVGIALAIACGALAISCSAVAAVCQPGKLVVQVLGSGGPELSDQRASTSYLVWVDQKARILIDFGSGAALNYEKSGANPADLDAVLFSHFHVDHTADFPALVKGLPFTGYNKELRVFGPAKRGVFPGVKEFVHALFNRDSGAYAYLADYADPDVSSQFKMELEEVAPKDKEIKRYHIGDGNSSDDVRVSAVAVLHGPVPSLAWRVDSKDCSVTFSGDTSNSDQALDQLAQGTDVLVAHNAARENDPDEVARLLHMMPTEIGRIAGAARPGKLVLSHRMKRTLGHEMESTAAIRKNYAGTILFANDMQRIIVGGK